jgi:hypothetical protein
MMWATADRLPPPPTGRTTKLPQDNDADDNDTNAQDTTRKKTLVRDETAAGTGGGVSALAVILPLCNNDIGGGPYDSALALSVAPRSRYDDVVPRHRWLSLVPTWTTMALS